MTPTHIILHHSTNKDGDTFDWNSIRDYHTKVKGWNGIGYHFGIERVNKHYEIIFGRMPHRTGAHCRAKGMNRKSIGVCFMGNFELHPVPPDQWAAGVRLVRWLCSVLAIPSKRVLGHREVGATLCPGKYFNPDAFRLALNNERRR